MRHTLIITASLFATAFALLHSDNDVDAGDDGAVLGEGGRSDVQPGVGGVGVLRSVGSGRAERGPIDVVGHRANGSGE